MLVFFILILYLYSDTDSDMPIGNKDKTHEWSVS